jgi:diketogulonate reductase-like aldo/keto reductase
MLRPPGPTPLIFVPFLVRGQVALAWVTRWPNVVAIPGASSVEQLERNAAAADLELSDDEHTRLTTAAEDFHPVQGRAVLPELLRRRLRS